MPFVETVIGYKFKNKKLLKEALTHKSYSAEHGLKAHNERLEFLGDSVLGLIVSYYLFDKYPSEDEGYLSKIKSYVVSKPSLTKWSKAINLGEYVNLGRGEEQSGGRKRSSILSNAIEAVIGAVYIDGGLEPAANFITNWLSNQSFENEHRDYKSELQEIIQKRFKTPPDYEVLSTEGPEHAKIFTVKVKLKKKVLGIGTGKNKKEAQQEAAKSAFIHFRNYEV
ncbi:MAG: ribonuclease III [Elusimicrobia bacterium]|nr:ribonuclease III [Elusimicrobiota bacterium]